MRSNIEQELQEKLKSKEQKNKLNKIDGNKDYKYLDAIVIFFGTLGPLYILFFIGYSVFMRIQSIAFTTVGIGLEQNANTAWILPILHGLIWIAAIYSVYRKKSILDDLIKRL